MAHSERFAVHKGPAGEIDVRRDRGMAVVSDNGERGDEHGARSGNGASAAALQLRRQFSARNSAGIGARSEREYRRAAGTVLKQKYIPPAVCGRRLT